MTGAHRAGADVVLGGVRVVLPHRAGDPGTGASARRSESGALRVALRRLTRARWRPTGSGRCGACGAPLVMPPRRTARAVTVEPPASAPWTLELELPLTRCPDCGIENVPVATRILLRRALRRALAA